jgi:hypothetical protein
MASGALTTDLCGLLAAAVAGGFALFHLALALWNPNGDLEHNRQRAEREIAADQLEVVQPGSTPDPRKMPANLTLLHGLALLGLLLAGPAFLAAVYLRTSNGWVNHAEIRPELVGPGDELKVDMPARHVQAVRSTWRGEATAQVLNAAEVNCTPTLKATTRNETWGESFRVKSEENGKPIHPYACLMLPDDPALGGKTLRVRVRLSIVYPAKGPDRSFHNERTSVVRDVNLQLTPAEGRSLYWTAWSLGAVAGFVGCILGGLVLMWQALRLGSKALPSTVVSVRS